MRKIRKIILLLLTIINLVSFSGCWDLREINEIGLVTAVGVDKGSGPNRYAVTVQIANPSIAESSSIGGKAKSQMWIGTEEGASIFDAARKLSSTSSRRIIWAHNNAVIIGEALAREGIIPVIDFFTHNPELRMKSAVAIAKGDAKRYISAKAGMESPSGVSYILMESYRSLLAESVESHMLLVSAALKNAYSNPLISEVKLEKLPQQSEDDKSGGSPETMELSGAAVFKRDKMIGWLSPVEARGVSWILNETKDTVVTVTDPEHGNKSVSVETFAVKSKIKTKVIDGMPEATISISGRGDIVEEDGITSQSMSEVKESITKLVNKLIEEEVRNSMEVIQKKYMVDVLGFAAIVHTQNNTEWESGLKDKWPEIFPQIPVNVSAAISITSSVLNQQPNNVYPDGSKK
jgi:spore germination protein KC